jgi:hypothetical protein
MLFRAATMIGFALLAACGVQGEAGAQGPNEASNPNAWVIGPIVRGRVISRDMPLHPTPRRNGGWYFDFPEAPGSVHAVTFPHGSLSGKRRIVMRYRIEMDPGVRIAPRSSPASASMITLYFQRSGDNWTGRRSFEAYRWFATFATQSPLTAGNHVMVAPLDGNWTAIETSSARTNPIGFRDAIAEADQVGFVLGGGDGYGHGVFATGRARLIVTDFRVE